MTVTREGDAVIVTGLVEHGVYPTRHDDIDQVVILSGTYDVRGGIYGRELRATGSGTVHGPVVTRKDLLLDQREAIDSQTFLAGLTAPSVIRNMVPSYDVGETCVVDIDNARLRIRGPVVADVVHLSNALVIGNIHARQVTLEHCVVFGLIECAETLVMNTCNFVAYKAGRARLMGRLSSWLGHGVSDDGAEFLGDHPRLHLEPWTDEKGRKVPADLRFLPACMSGTACARPGDFETCDDYHGGTCPSCVSGRAPVSKVSLTNLDFRLRPMRTNEADPMLDVEDAGDGRSVQRMRLSTFVQKLGDEIPFDRARLRLDGGSMPFHEHPVFRDHCKLTRVLSASGRLLSAKAAGEAFARIGLLARALALYPCLTAKSRADLEAKRPAPGESQIFDLAITMPKVRHASTEGETA